MDWKRERGYSKLLCLSRNACYLITWSEARAGHRLLSHSQHNRRAIGYDVNVTAIELGRLFPDRALQNFHSEALHIKRIGDRKSLYELEGSKFMTVRRERNIHVEASNILNSWNMLSTQTTANSQTLLSLSNLPY